MEYVGGGVDYNSGPYMVRFDAGVTNVAFIVIINDDNVLENDETFDLNINPSSLHSGVTAGAPGQATVTILANDGECKLSTKLLKVCFILSMTSGKFIKALYITLKDYICKVI